MKFLVLLTAIIIEVNCLSVQQARLNWVEFKANYSKQYRNSEDNVRFLVFQDNLRKIEEHNAKYAKGEVSYYLGITQFADQTAEEFSDNLSSQLLTKSELENVTIYSQKSRIFPPGSIDWREKGADLGIKNQKSCGSCWAFSAIGSLEGQLAIKKKKKILLSEQQLVDCGHSTGNKGCSGGRLDYAFKYVQKNGICSDESYPYTSTQGTCQKCTKVLEIFGWFQLRKSETALRNAVGIIGPVSVGVSAANWALYKGGIFDDSSCKGVRNHAVVVVGYKKENNKNYWIIKNSWGKDWGEDGYMRMVRGKQQCEIHTDAVFPKLWWLW